LFSLSRGAAIALLGQKRGPKRWHVEEFFGIHQTLG
jgi:hypothetical protein